MKVIRHKTKSTRAWLLATSDDDVKVIKFLFGEKICWGFYSLWDWESFKERPDQKHVIGKYAGHDAEDNMLIEHFKTTVPNLRCIGFLNSPEGFVNELTPHPTEEEVNNG